jgi:hypothetical protein
MTQASIECRAGDNSLLLRVPGTGAPQWLHWGSPVLGLTHGRIANLPLLPMNPGTAWVLELEAC